MNTINIQELEKLDTEKITLIDIRSPEDYARGTYKNAVNVAAGDLSRVPRGKPVYVLCYTGENSLPFVEKLCDMGFDAYNIDGGWRAYLKLIHRTVTCMTPRALTKGSKKQ